MCPRTRVISYKYRGRLAKNPRQCHWNFWRKQRCHWNFSNSLLLNGTAVQTLMQQHEQLQAQVQQAQRTFQPVASPITLPSSAGNYTVNETKSCTIVHFSILWNFRETSLSFWDAFSKAFRWSRFAYAELFARKQKSTALETKEAVCDIWLFEFFRFGSVRTPLRKFRYSILSYYVPVSQFKES